MYYLYFLSTNSSPFCHDFFHLFCIFLFVLGHFSTYLTHYFFGLWMCSYYTVFSLNFIWQRYSKKYILFQQPWSHFIDAICIFSMLFFFYGQFSLFILAISIDFKERKTRNNCSVPSKPEIWFFYLHSKFGKIFTMNINRKIHFVS